MRFALSHKLTTYLMVGCSFCALVLSGELGIIPVFLATAGFIGSWFWEPPRISYERYDRAWTGIAVAVFLYSVFDFLTGNDVLIVAAHFLLFLQIAKLFNRRACKDYMHVYILSFLMMVAGTVLNAEFTYGLFFLGFVVTSTWAITLFHLRREMEDNFLLKHSGDSSERVKIARILNSRRIVGRPFFLGTSAISIGVFIGSSIIFLAIPRIGFGLFFSQSRSSVSMAGFSDGVQLGGHGLIKDDKTVVMRVKVDERFRGVSAPSVHWRGVAFDYYSEGEWRRSSRAPQTRRLVSLEGGVTRHYLLYDQPSPRAPTELLRGKIRQEIYLEPMGYDVLFGASMPQAFEFPTTWRERARKEKNDEIRHPHQAGIKYVVYSEPDAPSPAELRRAKTALAPEYEIYLQLPDEITDEVRQLAREITASAETQYDKAVAIESWLRENLDYTLQMASPGEREPIDFFLFDRKKGHCEYFSSAMAVMTRAVGVPSRNVNGFLGGEWNEYDDYIAVRAGDAHSWVEVYFPEHGWVTFDPTPAATAGQLGRGEPGVLDRLRRWFDTLRFKWFKWVIEYDLYRQMSLFKEIGGAFKGGGKSVKSTTRDLKEWLRNHVKETLIGAVLIVLAVVIWNARRRRRRALDPNQRSRRTAHDGPMAKLYRGVLERLAKRGFPRAAGTTPKEHAETLLLRSAPGAAALVELTELYYDTQYGHGEVGSALPRAKALRARIEEDLRGHPKPTGAGASPPA